MESSFSHERLLLGADVAVLVSGPHVQVLDVQSGVVLHAAKITGEPILCAALDGPLQHLVLGSDEKKLRIFALPELTLLSERNLPKKPTGVLVTPDSQTVLIADKFGDVHRYPLHPPAEPVIPSAPAAEGEEGSEESLVLGHTSLLTALLLSHDGRFVLTADRDEHIRVSWFPQGYVVESYCLGHTKFVSAIHIPSSMPDTLVSGGGDAMLKIWNWQSGKLTGEIPVLEVITPFIVVLPVRPGRRVETGDGEGKPHGRKGRAKAKRSKARTEQNIEDSGSAGTFDTPPTGDVEIPAVDIDEAMPDAPTPEVTTRTPDTAEPVAPADADAPQELVLVIAKIRTFTPPSSSPTLVFSATGATAIFYAPVTAHASVHAVDLGAPVLDFALEPDGRLWVLLDPTKAKGDGGSSHARCLVWQDDQFRDAPAPPAFLSALNATALIAASTAECAAHDHYATLSSLPKLWDVPGADDEGAFADQTLAAGTAGSTGARPVGQAPARGRKPRQRGDGPTAREEARAKLRRAVADRVKAQGGPVAGATGDDRTPEEMVSIGDPEVEAPAKKTKVDGGEP